MSNIRLLLEAKPSAKNTIGLFVPPRHLMLSLGAEFNGAPRVGADTLWLRVHGENRVVPAHRQGFR